MRTRGAMVILPQGDMVYRDSMSTANFLTSALSKVGGCSQENIEWGLDWGVVRHLGL
jgi:hypothetical protein